VLPTTSWIKIRRHLEEVAAAVVAIRPGEYRELHWAG
jgi:hypothetical protein